MIEILASAPEWIRLIVEKTNRIQGQAVPKMNNTPGSVIANKPTG
jgi:hypothetical protein